ncbi:MAG: hypothetical protein U5N86_07815 [Planctomycetota bacterium]|nr:hypothetical protein [Planctomycetota bacterium]
MAAPFRSVSFATQSGRDWLVISRVGSTYPTSLPPSEKYRAMAM